MRVLIMRTLLAKRTRFVINTLALTGLCFVFFAASSFAETRSSVLFELGADNAEGNNHYLAARHQLDNGLMVNASTSKSTSIDSSNTELQSTMRSVGLRSDSKALINVGVDFSFSEQVDSVDTRSTRLSIEANTFDWFVAVSPEFRDITIQTAFNRTIDINSEGVAISLGYYGWDPFYVSVNKQSYSYSRDLSALNNQNSLITRILGSATTDQIFALEDDRTSLELGYYFRDSSIAFSNSQGSSVVDGSISTNNRLSLNTRLNEHWGLALIAGRSSLNISGSTATAFASVGLRYRW